MMKNMRVCQGISISITLKAILYPVYKKPRKAQLAGLGPGLNFINTYVRTHIIDFLLL